MKLFEQQSSIRQMTLHFFRISVCLRRILSRMTFAHRRHITGVSSIFFKLTFLKELAIRKAASWKKECCRHSPVDRHFDLGAYISQFARPGNRPCHPRRDPAEIHSDKQAEQDNAGGSTSAFFSSQC